MRFSKIFFVALSAAASTASVAYATVSRNGIVANGGFNFDASSWDISTNRNGIVSPGPERYEASGSRWETLGWQWITPEKRVKDGTLAPNFGIISQKLTGLVPNGWYMLSFAAYNDNSDSDKDYFLRVKIDGVQISQGSSLSLTNLVITQTIKFQAPETAASGVVVSFESQNNAAQNYIDEVGITSLLSASQAAVQSRKRRLDTRDADELCSRPSEKACPVSSWTYRADLASNPAVLKKVGGWECIEVEQDLESCGGCASVLGEGVNCLDIPGVNTLGVSCSAGQCVIDSCLEDYTVSDDRSTCIPK